MSAEGGACGPVLNSGREVIGKPIPYDHRSLNSHGLGQSANGVNGRGGHRAVHSADETGFDGLLMYVRVVCVFDAYYIGFRNLTTFSCFR